MVVFKPNQIFLNVILEVPRTKRRATNSIHKNLFEARYVSNDNK